jgi:hypothetical protein
MRTSLRFKDKDVAIFELPVCLRFFAVQVSAERLATVTYSEFEDSYHRSYFYACESVPEFRAEAERLYGDQAVADYMTAVILEFPNPWLSEVIDSMTSPIMEMVGCFREAPRLGNSKLYIKFLYCIPIGLEESEFKEFLALHLSSEHSPLSQLQCLNQFVESIKSFLESEGK